jgi:acyl carrier protein
LADRSETAVIVRDAIARLWPERFDERQLADRVSLGEDGLELDSIEIVELLLESAERLGVPGYDADELLDAGPITLGRLIDHLAAA